MPIDVPNLGAGFALGAFVSWCFHWMQSVDAEKAHRELLDRFDGQARQVSRLQDLLEAQLAGQRVEVERDAGGRITGGHVLHAEPATLTLTGQPATLRVGGVPDAESRSRGIT